MPSIGPAEQTKKHTETLFSVVIDPEQSEGSVDELATKTIDTLLDLGLKTAESQLLRKRLTTGPATVCSNLPRTDARRLVASLALRSVTAKLSRVAAESSSAEVKAPGTAQGLPTAELEQPPGSQKAEELPDTEPVPLMPMSSASLSYDDPTEPVPMASSAKAVNVVKQTAPQVDPTLVDDRPTVVDVEPVATDKDPSADGANRAQAAEPAEPVVGWGDVVPLDSADHEAIAGESAGHSEPPAARKPSPPQPVQASPPAGMVAMVPVTGPSPPPEANELLNIALGVDDESAGPAPEEQPKEVDESVVKRAVFFGALAPGGGQMYMGEGARARGYALVGLLIRPWLDGIRDARNLARSNTKNETSSAKAIGFVACYWLILLTAVWLIAGLFTPDQAPIVADDPPREVIVDDDGQDDVDAVEDGQNLAEELQERQRLAQFLQYMRDANRACEVEVYARCADLACRARDLIPEREDGVRLCHRATIAAAEQSSSSQEEPEPEEAPFQVPVVVPDQDEGPEE